MLVIGLTGGIGSGKSTAAQYFKRLGVPVIEADEIAREVVEPGGQVLERLEATFGPDILDHQGRLDRAVLRRIIFSDPVRRKQVEDVLHPAIRREMRRRLVGIEAPYCILAIPLLVEARQIELVDRVLVIDSSEELQRKRLASREGWTDAEIEGALLAQVTREKRLEYADDVIDNDADLGALERSVARLHRRYQTLAARFAGKHPSRRK